MPNSQSNPPQPPSPLDNHKSVLYVKHTYTKQAYSSLSFTVYQLLYTKDSDLIGKAVRRGQIRVQIDETGINIPVVKSYCSICPFFKKKIYLNFL